MKGVVLAGGTGSRLWPLSRRKYSKQFLELVNGTSLIDSTYKRILEFFSPEDIITITNKDYYFYVKDSCTKFSKELEKNIILESVGRNTAPAIALACSFIVDKLKIDSEKEVLFVFPSDHIIEPSEKFIEYLKIAKKAAEEGYLVTFGIKPTAPLTGYGYVKIKDGIYGNNDFQIVERFTEKPDIETAKSYLQSGNYLWNSGIFAFKVSVFLEELKKYLPEVYNHVEKGYDDAIKSLPEMPSISVDYAILEKSKKIVAIPMDILWSDVGSWDSFYDIGKKDQHGNVCIGDVKTLDTTSSLILSTKRLIGAVSINDLIVVETDDAIFLSRRGESQKVKNLLSQLEKEKREEVLEHQEVIRPWGRYRVLEKSERYKIKKVTVKPGETLSLQMHYHRSEHWVVIRGTAEVTVDNKIYFIHEGESTFVPKSTIHRLANRGKIPLEIIEIQNGEYVGEDDIERFDDKYGRIEKKK